MDEAEIYAKASLVQFKLGDVTILIKHVSLDHTNSDGISNKAYLKRIETLLMKMESYTIFIILVNEMILHSLCYLIASIMGKIIRYYIQNTVIPIYIELILIGIKRTF